MYAYVNGIFDARRMYVLTYGTYSYVYLSVETVFLLAKHSLSVFNILRYGKVIKCKVNTNGL